MIAKFLRRTSYRIPSSGRSGWPTTYCEVNFLDCESKESRNLSSSVDWRGKHRKRRMVWFLETTASWMIQSNS